MSGDAAPPALWVIDASPSIALAKIGRLAILERPGRRVLVPRAVFDEICAGPQNDPARVALESGFAAPAVDVEVAPAVLEWGLGAGESAVFSLALAENAVAILDDSEARAAAKALGVRVLGTLGIILDAHRHGSIESASTVLRDLRRVGLHLDDVLVREALARCTGETWEP